MRVACCKAIEECTWLPRSTLRRYTCKLLSNPAQGLPDLQQFDLGCFAIAASDVGAVALAAKPSGWSTQFTCRNYSCQSRSRSPEIQFRVQISQCFKALGQSFRAATEKDPVIFCLPFSGPFEHIWSPGRCEALGRTTLAAKSLFPHLRQNP